VKIVLNKRGLKPRTVEVSKIKIPNLWHIAMRQKNKKEQAMILKCWHLCHHLQESLEDASRDQTLNQITERKTI